MSQETTTPRSIAGIPRGLVILLGLAAAVIAGAGIQQLAWLIGPIFLALVLVICVSPVRGWLMRHGSPSWLATVVLVVGTFAIVIGLAFGILLSAAELVTVLPQYAGNANQMIAQVTARLGQLGGPQSLEAITSSVDIGKVANLAVGILSGVAGLATNLVFLLAVMLFLAVETATADRRMAVIAEDRQPVATALETFASGTRTYMVVTTVFGLIVAVLDTIALWLLGVPLALLWGLLAFLTNYVPNVGFIIGVIPPALLALLTGGWQLALIVTVVYIVLNFVVQSLIQPRFVGDSVGLSITVTFLALVFWAWLIGPLGAILAIPLTLLAKALLVDIDPRARWADALLGSAPKAAPDPEPEPAPDPPDPSGTSGTSGTGDAPPVPPVPASSA